MPTDIHNLLSSLPPIEWKRLLAVIVRKFDYLQQRGGPSPEDLLQTACEVLLNGQRNYPDGHDSPEGLCKVLWQVVSSLANHEYDCCRRKLEFAVVEFAEDAGPEAADIGASVWMVSEAHVDAFRDRLAEFRTGLADDPRLQIVLDGKLRGDDQREIAAQLQLSDASVTKLKKQLESRYIQFFGNE